MEAHGLNTLMARTFFLKTLATKFHSVERMPPTQRIGIQLLPNSPAPKTVMSMAIS